MAEDEEIYVEKLRDLKDFKKTINKKKVTNFELDEFFIDLK
ncbi:unnamed protein product [marine sediment metagenome]|uniref:Uncharacterized protein n=1 Tax=marine sediment metagenome TaxID=412755 RepID=X1UUP8_9ZZZZ